MKKPKKRAEAEISLIKSKETGKLYYALSENGNPLKYWAYEDMSDAARDFIGELVSAFDLGYDIRCQFPSEKDGSRVLIPRIMSLYNEPGSERKNKKVEGEFFQKEESDDTIESKKPEF